MNLSGLQKETHAIAKAHGWWDEPRTFGDLIADVHEALSGARRAYRKYGDTNQHPIQRMVDRDERSMLVTTGMAGVPWELANVLIQVADIAEHHGVDLASLRVGMNVPHDKSFGDYISFAHEYLSGAYSAYRIGLRGGPLNRWGLNMAWLVMFITVISERYGIDLDAAIAENMENMRSAAR